MRDGKAAVACGREAEDAIAVQVEERLRVAAAERRDDLVRTDLRSRCQCHDQSPPPASLDEVSGFVEEPMTQANPDRLTAPEQPDCSG